MVGFKKGRMVQSSSPVEAIKKLLEESIKQLLPNLEELQQLKPLLEQLQTLASIQQPIQKVSEKKNNHLFIPSAIDDNIEESNLKTQKESDKDAASQLDEALKAMKKLKGGNNE